MTQDQERVELIIRNVILVEKDNRGLNVQLSVGMATTVPIVGDAYQILKDDGSGEYQEYYVTSRIFREVTNLGESTAMFDVVAVMVRRPLQWQPE